MSVLDTALKGAHRLDIINGQIILEPRSGDQLKANKWVSDNRIELVREIAQLLEVKALLYSHYTTGRYTKQLISSVILHFSDLTSDQEFRACFNADLTRQRTTKDGVKGKPLPPKQFRIKQRSALLALWRRAGLIVPPRISTLYRHLGNLSSVILTGEANLDGKLHNAKLTSLSIEHSTIISAWLKADKTKQPQPNLSHNGVTSKSQLSHSTVTKLRHNKTEQPQAPQGLDEIITTRENTYKQSVKGLRVKESSNTSIRTDIDNHSADEWLADYDRGLEDLNGHERYASIKAR